MTRRTLIAALLPALFIAWAPPCRAADEPAKDTPFAKVTDDPALPRALVIGDSISIGYTVPTRALLRGKVNLHRIPTNGGPTTNGLKNLDKWLGDGKWDVIHFNWGLHDLKYINDKGQLVDVDKGKQQVPLNAYEKNLRELVKRLKKTGAKLIWCSTTPVPQGAKGRVPGDEVKYNAAAARVMKDEGIQTDDLYTFAEPRLSDIQRSGNVHFTAEGSQALAGQVAEHILHALQAGN
jgi:lysophospholipase L1-like esterase